MSELYVPNFLMVCLMVGKRKKGKLSLKESVLNLKLKDSSSVPGLSMTTFFFGLFDLFAISWATLEARG